MTTAYTSLLGLALPVTGELSGTWGDTVNTAITSLLDTAIAGTTSITTDADITLSTTTGASNQARQAIILWNPASGTTTRNITAPAQSKMYVVINASGGTQSIVIRGAGPTTGVTIAKGESATVAWNGSDFVKVSSSGGAITFTDLTVTGNTILGDAAADTLTVNATSTFASPVNFQGQVKLPSTGRSAAAALTVTNPAFLYGVASTYTDTTSSGTIAAMAPFYGIAAPTLSTSNVTTYSFASTMYLAGAPAAGGSATISNAYALYVNSGANYFGGAVAIAGNLSSSGTTSFTGNVTLGDAAADTLTVNSTITSNLIFTDNTYDIGASGATRPRNLYLAGLLTMGGALTVNGTSIDINPSSGNPNISLRTGNTYRGYIEGNSSGLTFGAGPAATTVLSLATTGAAVTGTGSFTGDVSVGNAVASTNVNINLLGVANKAKRLIFKTSGAESWLLGMGAASETDAFEIYNGNGTTALAINKTTSNSRFEGNLELYNSTGTYKAELRRLQWYNTANNYDTASIRGFVGVGQINRGELGFFVNNGGGQQNAMYILDTQYILMTGGDTSTASGAKLQIQTPSGQTNAIDLITTGGTTNNGGSLGMFSNTVYLSSNWYYAGSQYKRIAANASSSITLASGTTNADGYIGFSVGTTAATAPTEIARFNSDFQLLIGVTTASSTNPKLYVSSTLAFPSWSETTAIAGSAFRATTTGTTNNIILWNNSNYGYGIVGVNSATTGSSGGDVFSLGYTNSAGGAASPVFSWTSSGNAFIGGSTTAPVGVSTPYISKFDKMGGASTNAGLEYIKVITDNTATTILTVADSTKWAGTILISYVRDVDQNRSGMKMVRFAYNQTFTTLLDSSQNSGCTFSVSGNNIQVTIGGSGQYYCQIQIWGGAGA